jgi:hypothetical protein
MTPVSGRDSKAERMYYTSTAKQRRLQSTEKLGRRRRRGRRGRMNQSGRYLEAATTRRRLETPGRRPDPRDAPSHRNAAHLISGWLLGCLLAPLR